MGGSDEKIGQEKQSDCILLLLVCAFLVYSYKTEKPKRSELLLAIIAVALLLFAFLLVDFLIFAAGDIKRLGFFCGWA